MPFLYRSFCCRFPGMPKKEGHPIHAQPCSQTRDADRWVACIVKEVAKGFGHTSTNRHGTNLVTPLPDPVFDHVPHMARFGELFFRRALET